MEFRDDLDWIDYNPKGFNIHAGPFNIARLNETEFYMHLMIEDRHLNQGGVVHGGALCWREPARLDHRVRLQTDRRSQGRSAAIWQGVGRAGNQGRLLHGGGAVVRRTKDNDRVRGVEVHPAQAVGVTTAFQDWPVLGVADD